MHEFEIEREIEIRQIRNRLEEIRKTIFTRRTPIRPIQAVVTGLGKGPERMPARGWKPFKIGDPWGGFDQTTWFRMTAVIPPEMKGAEVVALIRPSGQSFVRGLEQLSCASESLAYVNGKPLQGLDPNREELFLTNNAKPGKRFEIVLESVPSTRFDVEHRFHHADLAVFNRLPWAFYWDGTVLLDVVEAVAQNLAPRLQLLDLVNRAVKSVDLTLEGAAYEKSLKRAQTFLRQGLEQFQFNTGMGKLTLSGHAHIDTAWLWPLRETMRKCGRTFSTVLDLMDRFPEFHFSASQPVQYEWMKQHYPEQYERIRKRVKEGRWELCGAPWCEPDCNVPSGESLVRQFVYGNRFFDREFGRRSRLAWQPDAFGYPWSLPQIMKKCGVDAFITTKISWGQFTKFPYSMFQWEGADGTRVFGLMPPLNYNGNPRPKDLLQQWDLFQQKEHVSELPFAFGWGDGGGGPTMTMIEYGKRLKKVAGLPETEFGRNQDCIDRMRAEVDFDELPVWNDELYLELHRACQTTQARTKRNNRKCEVLLHDAEFLSSLAMLNGGAYEQSQLENAWKIVLTNQFHDILPGSSITEVYTQTEKDYAQARDLISSARDKAIAHLARRIDTSGPGAVIVVFNTLGWDRREAVKAMVKPPRKGFTVVGPDGAVAPAQAVGDNAILFEATVPSMGWAVYHVVPDATPAPASLLKASKSGMENDRVRIKFNKAGDLTSVYDKVARREVLAPGARGNVLQLFEDRPYMHDAWDFDYNFAETMWEADLAESIEVVEPGPLRAIVRVVRKSGANTFQQDIVLHAHSARIDFITHADWRAKRTLLKVAFPVSIRSSRATYEIQFAAIERATHNNTAFERGRFEVAAQRWADLSEADYGVSLLNDCKYGYDVKGNVLRLSLLRAPIDPDPHADEGEHDFTYSLYPHAGGWQTGVVREGVTLNTPLLAATVESSGGKLPATFAFASADRPNVVIDTVKKAEDSKEIVLRVYEAHGARGKTTITVAAAPKRVVECDMMEENEQPVTVRKDSFTIEMNPYEIRTFKLQFSTT